MKTRVWIVPAPGLALRGVVLRKNKWLPLFHTIYRDFDGICRKTLIWGGDSVIVRQRN